MNEVFQRNKRAGRAGIDWCLCPSWKARQFVFFSSPGLVDVEGGEETLHPHLAVNMPEPASSNLETNCTTSAQSECAYRRNERVAETKKKKVLGFCIRVYKFILCTNKVHSSELLAPSYASVKIERVKRVCNQKNRHIPRRSFKMIDFQLTSAFIFEV